MRWIAVLPALALIVARGSSAQQVSYDGSLSAATGRYLFDERTSTLALGTGFSIRAGRLTVRATLPVWVQNTTLITTSGAGPIPTGGTSGQTAVRDSGQARHGGGGGMGGMSRSGSDPSGALVAARMIPAPGQALTGYELMLADPIASASLNLVGGSRVSVSAGGAVKLPLADTARIGTGKWDAGVHASVTTRVGNRWTLGVDGSWWSLGDLDSLELRDPFYGSLSVGRLLGSGAVMASLSAGTSWLEGFDPPVSVSVAWSRFGAPGSWGINAGAGLTETAADFTVGVTWSVDLRRRP
ncbi:MAG TPA: hypothetical protein VFN96_03295 [Gemmatimonadales bacterium]|nr:hypothetical protein [Gemmatimonadales bacterium]